jgi:hypothetical protein
VPRPQCASTSLLDSLKTRIPIKSFLLSFITHLCRQPQVYRAYNRCALQRRAEEDRTTAAYKLSCLVIDSVIRCYLPLIRTHSHIHGKPHYPPDFSQMQHVFWCIWDCLCLSEVLSISLKSRCFMCNSVRVDST